MKRKSHLVISVLLILVCPLFLMIIEAQAAEVEANPPPEASFSSPVTLWEQIPSSTESTINTTKDSVNGILTFSNPWVVSATGSTTSFDCAFTPNLIQGFQGKKEIFAGYGAGLCDIAHGSKSYGSVPSGIYMTGSVKTSKDGKSATVSGSAELYFGKGELNAGVVGPYKFSYKLTF